jgi:hypothetical protein
MVNALMSRHAAGDWCHLCGKRDKPTTDVWYANNAENDKPTGKKNSRYIRICSGCGDRISGIATGPDKSTFDRIDQLILALTTKNAALLEATWDERQKLESLLSLAKGALRWLYSDERVVSILRTWKEKHQADETPLGRDHLIQGSSAT